MNRISGSTARARANPTRCFMPPESSLGYAVSNPFRPTACSVRRARRCRSACSIRRASSGTSTFSSTVSQGNSAKLWNTMATFGLDSPSGLPCHSTSPADGFGQAGEHAQQRGFARAGRPQQRDDHARLDGQAWWARSLASAPPSGPGKTLLDLPGLDDRFRDRWNSGGASSTAGAPSSRMICCQDTLRQFVQKIETLHRIHFVDDLIHLPGRKGVQKHERVVITQDRREFRGELHWQPTE